MRTPIRTCIGCRERGPAAGMARLALVDECVVPWARRRPTGRGASIHPTAACVEEAIRRGAFARAFRGRVKGVETVVLLERIAAVVRASRI